MSHLRVNARRIVVVAVLAVVVMLLTVPVPVSAWYCMGHMTVTEIARRRLTPENLLKADAIASSFRESGPFDNYPDMVQLSCWADELHSWGQSAMATWHYIDTPYNPDKIPLPPNYLAPGNVVNVANDMVSAIEHAGSSPQYNINFAFANLIHFVGDMHQPLHASNLFNKQYPKGDNGGNAETISAFGEKMKLHALWDSMCQEHPPPLDCPLSKNAYYDLRLFADRLEQTYHFPATMRFESDFAVMAQESHEFAVNTTYIGGSDGATMSQDYLYNCRRITEARVTLAGHRLGNLLNRLLDPI